MAFRIVMHQWLFFNTFLELKEKEISAFSSSLSPLCVSAATHLLRHGRPSENLLVPTPPVQKTINLLLSNKRLGLHRGANRKALKPCEPGQSKAAF